MTRGRAFPVTGSPAGGCATLPLQYRVSEARLERRPGRGEIGARLEQLTLRRVELAASIEKIRQGDRPFLVGEFCGLDCPLRVGNDLPFETREL